ncbi:MAG: polyprenyl synthetase family protein [Acidobacteria bacterium]|nr:polyprenyl synthetase family protein [Acidobacteriota bacterium]
MNADPVSTLDLDLRAELEHVEGALRAAASSDEVLVQEAAGHLLAAGGKRFRPMLVLLAGRLGNPADPRLIPCAAAIELTHLATLYHDDVIDEAAVRRGAPSANARYDNTVAILTGDFLFARASGLAADLGTYVSRVLADTIAALCEGQIMEFAGARSLDATAGRYLEVIRRKTAALIATSCHLGAWLAGAPPELVSAATEYGEAIGMAFQLFDDVLDIAGQEEESGKVPGTDLREGVYTLPALATLAGEAPGGPDLRRALEAGDVAAALGLLRSNGALEIARRAVAQWQGRAVRAIEPVPAGAARDALERLAAFVGSRTG